MKNILSLLVTVAAMAASANTWYVDDDNYKEDFTAADYIAAGFDGTDKAKAFGTIQAAIDAASTKANDTILVCPGEYNQGVSNLVVQGSDCGAEGNAKIKEPLLSRKATGKGIFFIRGRP